MSTENNKLSCKIISDLEGFEKLENDWSEILGDSSSDNIFLSWSWLFNWWKVLGNVDGQILNIILVSQDSRLIGIAPCYLKEERQMFLGHKVLRFLSDQRYISRKLDFILRRGYETMALDEIIRSFRNDKNIDRLNLFSLQQESVSLPLLQAKRGMFHYRETKHSFSSVDLADWEKFLNTLHARMKTKVRSLLNKSEKLLADNKLELYFSDSAESFENDLSSFISMHQKRWNQRGHIGMFGVKGFSEFLTSLAKDAYKINGIRLFNLKFDKITIAHQLCLSDKSGVYLINEAFDEEFGEFPAGNMLRCLVFKYLHDNQISHYDFLNNYSEHKARWGAIKQKQLIIEIGKRNFKNFIYFNYWKYREALKRVLIKVLPDGIIELKQNIHLGINKIIEKRNNG